MAKKSDDKRFEVTYTQGAINALQILVDKQTGVNYLFCQAGYGAGLTALLDKDGKPVITPIGE